MLDLLIRGGVIIDATGNPGICGAIGVADERVTVLRGDVSSVSAARVIDAGGHIVRPGFIDMHAHSGLVILAEPRHEPKVHQGITTELIGIEKTGTRSHPARPPSREGGSPRLRRGARAHDETLGSPAV